MINCVGGCWHIYISKTVTVVYVKQVTVEQHIKEIYYLETKKFLFKKAPTLLNRQLAALHEHFLYQIT